MRKILTIASLSIAVLLAGCASSGNMTLRDANQQQVDAHLTRGKTTKADVTTYLGAPDEVSFGDSGGEQWTYQYAHATTKAITLVPVVGLFAGGQNLDKKQLVVLFDDKGVVRKYTFAASNGEIRTGLSN